MPSIHHSKKVDEHTSVRACVFDLISLLDLMLCYVQVRLASKRFLAGALGVAAGVMFYVSLVEIFVKSQIAFSNAGFSDVRNLVVRVSNGMQREATHQEVWCAQIPWGFFSRGVVTPHLQGLCNAIIVNRSIHCICTRLLCPLRPPEAGVSCSRIQLVKMVPLLLWVSRLTNCHKAWRLLLESLA